ncbi:hypothetical protein EGW08_019386, partial [Elysia chlorotica]
IFRFENHLALLSALRIFKPIRIVVHYREPPRSDSLRYHSWWEELRQSVPTLVLRPAGSELDMACERPVTVFPGPVSSLSSIFEHASTGAPAAIVSAFSAQQRAFLTATKTHIPIDISQGMIVTQSGFDETTLKTKLFDILNTTLALFKSMHCSKTNRSSQDGCPQYTSRESVRECHTAGEFNSRPQLSPLSRLPIVPVHAAPCVVLRQPVFPRDIWGKDTKFAELARWLFYGARKKRLVIPASGFHTSVPPLIPNIHHMVWTRSNLPWADKERFSFLHYLSALSALYVAGASTLLVHGDVEPWGEWWERLLKLSTKTRTTLDPDRDVIWTGRVPVSIRRYPAVACPDWPRYGEWPASFNLGVLMARPGAEYLRRLLASFRFYKDEEWSFNAILMPYKVYERNPELLYVDHLLQTICFMGICHPTWSPDYIRPLDDKRPVDNFRWWQTRSLHFTFPKPPASLASPAAARRGTDMAAQVARMVLRAAGQAHLLDSHT